jgi:hypothetical protein
MQVCVSRMMSVCSSPSGGSFWIIASIEISRSARIRVMSASTPGLSRHAHPQVVARLDLAHRQEGKIGELIGLEREVRHAMPGVRRCASASRRPGRRSPRSPSARRPAPAP